MLPESFLFLLEQEEKRRQQREDAGLPALTILIDAAHSGGGQARHIRRFLLGLYKASRWPFELNRLRALDTELQQAALQVLALDWMAGRFTPMCRVVTSCFSPGGSGNRETDSFIELAC